MEKTSDPHESVEDAAREAERLAAQLNDELNAFDRSVRSGQASMSEGRDKLAAAAAAAGALLHALRTPAITAPHPTQSQTVDSE